MDSVLQDIHYAVRMLSKDRGFTLTAILTLALCLGANAAVFAIINAVLLRPLPLPDADRILLMSNQYPKGRFGGNYSFAPDYFDRRRDLTVFDEQAMFNSQDTTIEVGGTVERVRAMATTPIMFALTALALATIGLYGVLAYLVAARRREFGIRMALGGTLRDIARLIVREGGALAVLGLAIGLVAGVGVSGLIRDQLYEVHPLDSRILSAVALTIGTVALAACKLPARRVSRVNPAIVLAQE